MLAHTLRSAQLQLRGHRQWLRSFQVAASYARGNQDGIRRAISEFNESLRSQNVRYLSSGAAVLKGKGTKTRTKKKPHQSENSETAESSIVEELQQALQDVRMFKAINLFRRAKALKILDLTRSLTFSLAQCLHEALRREKRIPGEKPRGEDNEYLLAFASELVKYIRKGELQPDRRAHSHLLAIFRESSNRGEGVALWKWLESQGDDFVDCDVYGVAIQLLAFEGTPLPELEDLYQTALQRFPGNFNAYHLAPNAIVADREKPTSIQGIPMILLLGILHARLLAGRSRDAYMALDTALRLYPALVPPHFFRMFMEDRPLSEAYTVFAIACRAGIVVPFDAARRVISVLRAGAGVNSYEDHVSMLRQILSMLFMYIGGGGKLTSNVVNEVIIAISQTLRLEGIERLDDADRKRVVSTTMDAIRKVIEIAARYGAKPGISAFNSIIANLGGFGRSQQVVGTALLDAQALGLAPTIVTYRSILAAAGQVGNQDLVAESWHNLVEVRAEAGERPDATDHHILIKAAKLSDAVGFATEACEPMDQYLSSEERDAIYERLYRPSEDEKPSSDKMVDADGLLGGIKQLQADLEVIDERTKAGPDVLDFSEQRLPIYLTSVPRKIRLPESELRSLYDTLTTEQRPAGGTQQPKVENEEAGTTSSTDTRTLATHSTTNIPVGTLRYENWKAINYLLALSEQNDAVYHKSVDAAISIGLRPPSREKVVRLRGEDINVLNGLSDASEPTSNGGNQERWDPTLIEMAKNEILILRGLDASS